MIPHDIKPMRYTVNTIVILGQNDEVFQLKSAIKGKCMGRDRLILSARFPLTNDGGMLVHADRINLSLPMHSPIVSGMLPDLSE